MLFYGFFDKISVYNYVGTFYCTSYYVLSYNMNSFTNLHIKDDHGCHDHEAYYGDRNDSLVIARIY